MLRRIILGSIIGLVVGGLVAFGLIQGLGVLTFGPWLAYPAALVTGIVTAALTGKRIWQRGALIEVGLKSVFGALMGLGLMFAIRRWLDYSLDLESLGAGSGALGDLPAVALPMIAWALGAFYEADNTPQKDDGPSGSKRKGELSGKKRVETERRAPSDEADPDEESGSLSQVGAHRR